MSEVADFVLPVSSRPVAGTGSSPTYEPAFPAQTINDARAFPYLTRRWLSGVRRAAAALVSGGIGVFLLSHITSTPALVVQVAMLGTLLTLGGIVWGVQSLQDFLGRLVIDDSGMHQLPALFGFSIAWDDLRRWEVRDDVAETLPIPSVRFWGTDCGTACGVPSHLLSDADRQHIRRVLQRHAPRREVRASTI